MKTSEKAFYLVTIVLLLTVGALGWLLKQKNQTIEEKENLIVALTDTIEIRVNERGQQTAKVSQLQTARIKDFLKIKSQDSTIKRLQEEVSRNKSRLGESGSVTVFSTSTKSSTTVKTGSVSGKDTILVQVPGKPDTLKIYPEYKSSVVLGKWIDAQIKSNKDSTSLNLKVENEYTVVIGTEKVKGTGFLGIGSKHKAFSEVTNLNPYSSTQTLRTYSVLKTDKPKRISLGIQGGYSPFNNRVYIGVGIQYNLINLF